VKTEGSDGNREINLKVSCDMNGWSNYEKRLVTILRDLGGRTLTKIRQKLAENKRTRLDVTETETETRLRLDTMLLAVNL
jgi:hypothetical protein